MVSICHRFVRFSLNAITFKKSEVSSNLNLGKDNLLFHKVHVRMNKNSLSAFLTILFMSHSNDISQVGFSMCILIQRN